MSSDSQSPVANQMTMAAHDASARWRTFLEEAKEAEVMTLLSRQSNFPYLSIPFHELQTFDPDFAEDVPVSYTHLTLPTKA